MRTRPLVIAHRGLSAVAPENTLAAYRRAIDLGVEMAECDVALTSDGHVVLMHDDTLERTTGHRGRVEETSLDTMQTLDAGRWFGEEFGGEPVPTLAEVLELVRGKLRLVVEIKAAEAAGPVAAVIEASEFDPSDVVIFSFHQQAIVDIAALQPGLPTVWLLDALVDDASQRAEILGSALRARVQGVGVHHGRLDAAFVRQAHERGLTVYVWTVNDEADMKRCCRLGVDVLITDHPDRLLRLL